MPTAERLTLADVLAGLATGPDRIETVTSGVPPDALLEPLESGGWSARDVVAHLRACQWTLGGYIGRILDEDHPTFRYESPRTTIRRTDFLTRPFSESLERLKTDRAALLPRLRAAGADLSVRTATVKLDGRGPVERSAFDYAHQLARHEREHVGQLERAMAERRGA
jgi:hypothetical protein